MDSVALVELLERVERRLADRRKATQRGEAWEGIVDGQTKTERRSETGSRVAVDPMGRATVPPGVAGNAGSNR